MDPYSGKYETVLTEEQVTEAMPFLDVQRESYEFFSDFSIQGNTYIAIFPAYNDLNGTYAAMFDRKGMFIGAILCTESEIRYIDQTDGEKASAFDEKLKGLLYAPMR